MRIPGPLRRLAACWEAPFLALLAGLMFLWRWPSYALNVTADRVYYMGTDPYYHLRALLVSLENFPRALRWDPWTFFPRGTYTGQFGTLFDQILAAAVLAMPGEPTRALAERALAVYPAVLGALCVVPVYFLARRAFGNPGAAWSAVVLALLPGSFFSRSVAAHADHHVAEALMSTVAVLGLLVAVERARAAEEIFHDWRAHRRGILRKAGWGAAGALALAAYVWTWPPGAMFAGILAGALGVVVAVDHARGRTSRGTAFGASVAFAGAALLVLPIRDTNGFEVTFFTWTQPVTLLLAAASVAVLAWASERLAKPLSGWRFLGAGVAAAALVTVLLALAAPAYFKVLSGGFQWVTGIGYSGGGRTIAEAQPSELRDMYREYGMFFWGAVAGLVLVAVDAARRPSPSTTVLAVWSAFMLLASFNQVRFNYYFAVNVALLNGYVLAAAARATGLPEAWRNTWDPPVPAKGRRVTATERVGAKQAATLAVALLVFLPGNVFLYDGATECRGAKYRPVWEVAHCMGPDREVQFWTDGLLWMRENTPDPGFDLGALHDPGTFRYPEGAYGVLSWWDYGHWTQVLAERPPVANPFQQAAPFASEFFTAEDEAEAERMLEGWSPDLPVRYVMIDDASASTKFGAIAVWAGFDGYAQGSRPFRFDGREVELPVYGDAYDRTMMSRLYRGDAEDLDHYRLVHEERQTTLIGNVVDANANRVRSFHDILDWGSPQRMARDYGSLNYRSQGLVCLSTGSADGACPEGLYAYDLEVHSALKVFERVEGAVIVGEAPPGTPVAAYLELEATTTGRVVSLEKHAVAGPDGTFRIRVAQPTTALLPVEDGGTNASVVARGPWLVAVGADPNAPEAIVEADVPESAVRDGSDVRAA